MIDYYKLLNNDVVNFCGEYPENFIKIDISSNSDYVFENDADFDSVQLFDVEGNIVFVNSFQECQHYVTGGWNFTPNQIDESQYHSALSVFSILLTFVGYLFIRKFLIGSSSENN